MFGKLRDKLKSWTKSLTKKAEEVETKDDVIEPKKEVQKEKLKEIKEVTIPKKFNAGMQGFEPDLEKLKEIEEELKEIPIEKKETISEIIDSSVGGRAGGKILEKVEKKETISEIIKPEKKLEESAPKGVHQGGARTSVRPRDISPEISTRGKKKSFFQRITSKITKVKISEKDFDVYEDELEMLLIENNVALEVSEKIIKRLREEIVGKELLKKEVEGEIKDSFKDIINEILVEPFDLIEKIKNREDKSKPYVVLFCGINGTGKTTTIAKIAQQLKDNKLTCVLAAADTFRAASIEQIKKHGDNLGVKVIAHEYDSDPAAVGFDAIAYAKKNQLDTVLIDTAGRMYTEKNLMSQIEKISKVTKPDTTIFVGESLTGNDIIEQVKSFDWAIKIDGIILSKADIDDKGGTALSVGYVTKKPILYLGTGQEYDAIEPFDKKKFIEKLGLDDE